MNVKSEGRINFQLFNSNPKMESGITAESEAVEIGQPDDIPIIPPTPKPSFIHSHGSFLSTISTTSCVITYTRNAKIVLCIILVASCIPLILGAAFTTIFIEDGNYNASVWACFTACLSLGSCVLLGLHLLAKLEYYYDPGALEGLKIFGMIASIVSGISLGVNTILSFFNKQAFSLFGANYFSSAVFSGLCLASGIQLFITAQWYQNALRLAVRAEGAARAQQLRPMSSAVN